LMRQVPTGSLVEYHNFAVNVPFRGGAAGAFITIRNSTNVSVRVVVVAVVVVVLVAICMLYVVLANRAATDASPTGKAYMYTRGDVTPHTSTPTVESSTTTVPLCNGKTPSKRGPSCTVAALEMLSARRNARSCAVPAASVVV
jgi:hypothetical protein